MAMFFSVLAGSCCCTIFRSGPKRTRYYLNHLSAGRLLAEQKYPGSVDKQVMTKTWIKMAGKRSVDLKDGFPHSPGASPAVGVATGAALAGTPGGSPSVGQSGFYEGKPGLGMSATEL